MWYAYLVCFMLGLAYAVIAAVFGAFGGDHGGGGHDFGGGHDLGGGHDIVAGYDATAADVGHVPGDISSEPAISPFSPPVVAMTLITFGGTGIIFDAVLPQWGGLSVLPSAGSGIGMGVLTFFFFYTVISKVQGSSSPSLADQVGITAEATTPIPPDGVGEIAYVARGARFTARAKSMTGATLASHSEVTIVRWVGNTAYVKPVDETPKA
jgi:membrane protein implicated in regulation of membrane protease activity